MVLTTGQIEHLCLRSLIDALQPKDEQAYEEHRARDRG